jgi:hypothetical protein
MGIVRRVLLGLENRCIFSLLLNAFEWRLRFKIWNWVGTLSVHGTAVIFWDIVQKIGFTQKIDYFVKLLLLDIALFEYAPHSIVNVNKQLKKGSTKVFFYFDKTTEQPELTEFVRKVLLGLKNRTGCIFSLLLNAFEWCLRFKIWNWVGTLSFHGSKWRLKDNLDFNI